MHKNFYLFLLFICIAFFSCNEHSKTEGNQYYLSASGNDGGKGTKDDPWKTLAHINSIGLQPGDAVFLNGGDTFTGLLIIDSADKGVADAPVIINSYGNGKAIISGTDSIALAINYTSNVLVKNLILTGCGRKDGNTKDGLFVNNSQDIIIDSIEISGFQKSGLLVYHSSDVKATNVYAHDNGFAGICVAGDKSKTDCKNIYIANCKADNNPGDPTNFDNHSGNGIIAGLCTNVMIEYCTATNNGWDMPRIGNGPVGIWCYEADSVTIQYCISYKNKTAKDAYDGGGFDFDGGTTNSVLQYCLSYNNAGSGIGIFQYAGASVWNNNIVRFNISVNDGLRNGFHGGILVWNGAKNAAEFTNCLVYNNTIINNKVAPVAYSEDSNNKNFLFINNIFLGKKELITGTDTSAGYISNNWWASSGGFMANGINGFDNWVTMYSKEQKNGKLYKLQVDPQFDTSLVTSLIDARQLKNYFNYKLPANSPLRNAGVDLKKEFNINSGDKNFNGQHAPVNGVGASF